MARYSTPIPITPIACCSPRSPNATYSASSPVARWMMLWTVPVTKMALPSPTSGLEMKPRAPTATRTMPIRAAYGLA